MHDVVAIIPARGGSKGVPRKNKRLVGGRPLIAYTFDAARQAKNVSRVLVTTDDPEIAELASEAGMQVIVRPPEIAGDASPVIDAVRHALDVLAREEGVAAQAVVLLQPTSPFREPADIDAAVELFWRNDRTPVCSVCRCEDNHPARMYKIENGRLAPLMPELAAMRRQDLPSIYHRNGSLYVFGPREVENGQIIGDAMLPYVMDGISAVNIDTELDLILMAAVLEQKRENPASRA